jgi:hypothetical protein
LKFKATFEIGHHILYAITGAERGEPGVKAPPRQAVRDLGFTV